MVRFILALTIVASAGSSAGQSPTESRVAPVTLEQAAARDTIVPDTPAGRRYRAFLTAVRAGTDDAITRFVEQNFDPAQRAERPALVPNLTRIAGMVRGARIEEVVRKDSLQVAVRFRTGDSAVTLELVAAPTAPHLLVDWRRD